MEDPRPRPVVTLWETYGSGATTVGPGVAAALGVPFVGQHYSSEELESADRSGEAQEDDTLLRRILARLGRAAAAADTGVYSGPAVSQDLQAGVQQVRDSVVDGGVVLGRNATVILADLPWALHVKLDGPLEQRIARGAAEAGIDPARARARQTGEDSVRAEMSLRYHNWDPRGIDGYDLVLNTGQIPLDVAVELIVAAHAVKSGALARTAPETGPLGVPPA